MIAAGSSKPHALGLWVRSAEHPEMWSMNQLFVIGPRPALTAAALTAELDRGLADARHRRAIVEDDSTGRGLANAMREAGYEVVPLMVMVLDGEPPEPPPGAAREIDEPAMRTLEQRIVHADAGLPADDRAVVLAGHAHLRSTVPGTRMFAGVLEGDDVCQATLYLRDAVGQPEDVQTHPERRGHGVAAATVSLATREALRAACDLVFVVCHADTGPFALYAELGYRAAGRYWTFTQAARPA